MPERNRPLRSPLLSSVTGLCHAFEVGLAATPGAAREDRRRVVADALAPIGRVWFVKQVHGVRVVEAPWETTPEADASLVTAPGEIAAVETADCVPVLLVDPAAQLAAAVHAGWRGTAAGVVGVALQALVARGARSERIQAAIGPCAGACCYEVGEELRGHFGREAAPFFIARDGGRPHLDLRGLNQRQLEERGVARERIDHVARCTVCDPAGLASYRRRGRGCGRIVSYVGWGRALSER